jgi:hypothetical protein
MKAGLRIRITLMRIRIQLFTSMRIRIRILLLIKLLGIVDHWSMNPPGSVADQDPGSGIGCLFDPWIRDPGWEKVSIRIRDEQPGSYFLELRNHFFAFLGFKYLNSLMRIRDPGWRQFGSGIRDGKKSDPGSGINIPDPPHCLQGSILSLQASIFSLIASDTDPRM